MRCGKLTRRWISNTEKHYSAHFKKMQEQLYRVHVIICEYGLNKIYTNIDGIVSPRYPILIPEIDVKRFKKIFDEQNIVIGSWFEDSPFSRLPLRFGTDKSYVCLNLPLSVADDPSQFRSCLDVFTSYN